MDVNRNFNYRDVQLFDWENALHVAFETYECNLFAYVESCRGAKLYEGVNLAE